MSEVKLLFKNSIFTFVSYIITALIQTFIYIRAAKVLGTELFGVWSFIYSGALVLGLSNVGLPNLLVKYSAKFLALKDYSNLTKYLTNSLILFFITFPIILLLTSLIFYFAIGGLHIEHIAINTYIFFAVLFFLQNISGLIIAFIDGIQMMYVRSIIQSVSNIIFGGITLFLLEKGQINSMVICQIIFYAIQIFLIFFYLIFIIRSIKFNFIRHVKFSKNVFVEILLESRNYFLIASSTIFFEPLARFLIGKYIGISSISYYEIANRTVGGVKTLYVNLSQSLLPFFSFRTLQTKSDSFILLKKVTNVVFCISVPVFILLPLVIFYFKNLLFPTWNNSMAYLIIATCAAGFMNIICAPSYFLLMALNQSKQNLYNHISYFIFLIFFSLLHYIFKFQLFILLAPAFALFLGSYLVILLLKVYLNDNSTVLDSYNRFTSICLGLIYFASILYIKYEYGFIRIFILAASTSLLIYYFSPLKKQILGIIKLFKKDN